MNKQETLKSRPAKALCLLVVLAYLQAGCAMFSGREGRSVTATMPAITTDLAQKMVAAEGPEPTIAKPAGLVARDFAGALKQLPRVSPQATTIYLPRDKAGDEFAQLISQELMFVGFAVRRADNLASNPMLRYTRSTEMLTDSARQHQYDVKVGEVEMRRTYIINTHGLIKPAGNMFIRGVDASAVVLDDSIFREQPGRANLIEASVASASRLPANANPLPEIFSTPPTPKMLTTHRQLSVSHNIFDTGVSRFNQHLPAQHIVAEEVLIFQNDSLRIGSVNKKLIGKMVARFQPRSDRFSVIGCSMGRTSLKGGNAALALGRANRVVEALMFSGVDRARIVDEGCWSSNGKRKGLPSRGVAIALMREDTTVD